MSTTNVLGWPELHALVADPDNRICARACIRHIAELPHNDEAIPVLLALSQTYATLAVADALTEASRPDVRRQLYAWKRGL